MAPLLAGLVNILPGVVNSVGKLVIDKNKATQETKNIMPALIKDEHNIADGIELSSKTVFGYGLGGAIVFYALQADPINLWVLGIGAAVAVGTTLAKALEKK